MSKVLDATCNNLVVTIAERTVDATILSKGKGASTGLLLIDKDKVRYVCSNYEDLEDMIASLVSVIGQISIILTGLDAVTNNPGAQAANILTLTTLKTQFDALKEVLR
jgi:hypothetical protein